MKKKRVLVLAYMISPYRGSEYSVAWNYVTYMSQVCELTVLYGASGSHMGDTDEMERYLKINNIINAELIPVRPSRFAQILNSANQRGYLSYTFYLAYRLWHKAAYQRALELLTTKKFDVIHYLGPIGYREPGYLWKIDIPYIWGPIGGANNIPKALIKALPLSDKAKLIFRAVVNFFQLRFSYRVRQALARVDVLLTATTENKEKFEKVHNKISVYIPENGIIGEISINREKYLGIQKISLIWIGSIEARKALIILIDALIRSKYSHKFIVHIVGEGPLRSELQKKVQEAGLTEILVWHGNVPRDTVHALLRDAHLHVITSVSEGNPTTIWESMSLSVPTMTIDHCGMHDTVSENCGIKIPLSSYETLVDSFANRLDALAEDPSQMLKLAEGVFARAATYRWDLRREFFLAQYDKAIINWQRHLIHPL